MLFLAIFQPTQSSVLFQNAPPSPEIQASVKMAEKTNCNQGQPQNCSGLWQSLPMQCGDAGPELSQESKETTTWTCNGNALRLNQQTKDPIYLNLLKQAGLGTTRPG